MSLSQNEGMLFLEQGDEGVKKHLISNLEHLEAFVKKEDVLSFQGEALYRFLLLYKYLLRKPKYRDKAYFEKLKFLLSHDAPKVRRRTAILFGYADEGYEAMLCERLKKEEVYFVQEALILSIGAIGGPLGKLTISTYPSDSKRVNIAKRKALSKLTQSEQHAFSFQAGGLLIKLKAQNVFVPMMKKDLKAKGALPLSEEYDGIFIRDHQVEQVKDIRYIRDFLFYPTEKWCDIRTDAMMRQLEKTGLIQHVLSQFEQKEGHKIGYRLALDLKMSGNQKKNYMNELIEKLTIGYESLFNAPSDYQFQLHVEQKENNGRWYVSFPVFLNRRFSYRLKDLPASISPNVAAGLVSFMSPYQKENNKVLDPFMGSGTLLIERALAGKNPILFGLDNAKQAIRAAKPNFKKAKVSARFILGDVHTQTFDVSFDEVITNMPFGHRVGVHKGNERLYHAFFENLLKWTHKESAIGLYTMEKKLMEKLLYAHRHQFKLEQTLSIDAGGLKPDFFILIRK